MTAKQKPKIAIYPGTFDPITNGHLDIVDRALNLFDNVIIALAVNPGKSPVFTLEERIEMIQKCDPDANSRVEIEPTQGLLVDYAHRRNAQAIVRGLRAVSRARARWSSLSSRLSGR